MLDALTWLLAIELLGLLALPVAFSLFGWLPDRGIPLAKPLALLLGSYVFWLVGHNPLFPPNRLLATVIVLVLATLCLVLIRRHGAEILAFLKGHWRVLLVGEVLFLAVYFMWVAIVSQSPAIINTEKLIDFTFLNGVMRADQFPPEDLWLAGNSISYYYFGHMMMAFLTKFTGISSAVSFNLGAPLVAAMVAAGAFSLVYNLIRLAGGGTRPAIIFGLAGPALVVLIGNLEGAVEFIYAQGWGSEGFWQWVAIPGLDGAGASDPSFFSNDFYWWWRAARVMNYYSPEGALVVPAITEFPFFIFLLGDLHAHPLSLPFLTLNLTLALNLFVSPVGLGYRWPRLRWWEPVVVALLLGSLAFINLWDFPVFAGILVAVLLVRSFRDRGGDVRAALVPALRVALPVVALAVIMYLPFYLSIEGRLPIILPLRDTNTRPLAFGLIWGLFLTVSVAFLLWQLWGLRKAGPGRRSALSIAVAVSLAPLAVWAFIRLLISPFDGGIINGLEDVGVKLIRLFPLLLIVGAAIFSGLVRSLRDQRGPMAFILMLMAIGFSLLMGVELFYLDDLFFVRLNTVFKAYFQAWLLLGLVSAFGLYYVWNNLRQTRIKALRVSGYAWGGLVAVLIVASLYYPLGAALDRARASDDPATLDGFAYLRQTQPAELEAILWLREEASWGRIVEAVGNDYSAFGRVSSYAGLPTILEWSVHQEHLRGSPKPMAGRRADVALIYLSDDPTEVQSLLQKYEMRYVFVGPRERDRYPTADLDKFRQFMTPVFDPGEGVVIYERLPMDQPQKSGG